MDDIQPEKKLTESSEITGNEWNISLPRSRIHTLEELIEYCEIDLGVWEVERFVANKWEMAAVLGPRGDERIEVTPLFQVKATLKKRAEMVDARKEIEELKALAFQDAPIPPVADSRPASGNMLELNIPDAHFGKLAWAIETGGPNYDTKIAEELFLHAAETLLQRVSHFQFEEVLVVLGNDILQSDDIEGRTTKGTYVDTDTRYQKTFTVVRNVSIRLIERARQVANRVKVIMVPGNHDTLSVWHLGDSLECYFHRYDDVTIENTPRARKYHQFGKVMLMFTHGDKGKKANYPLLMATEEKEMFGATSYREIHTGHLHKTKLDEELGIKVRILPALCPADAWHAEMALVGNLRSAEAYVWNKDEGLIDIAIYTKREE